MQPPNDMRACRARVLQWFFLRLGGLEMRLQTVGYDLPIQIHAPSPPGLGTWPPGGSVCQPPSPPQPPPSGRAVEEGEERLILADPSHTPQMRRPSAGPLNTYSRRAHPSIYPHYVFILPMNVGKQCCCNHANSRVCLGLLPFCMTEGYFSHVDGQHIVH